MAIGEQLGIYTMPLSPENGNVIVIIRSMHDTECRWIGPGGGDEGIHPCLSWKANNVMHLVLQGSCFLLSCGDDIRVSAACRSK